MKLIKSHRPLAARGETGAALLLLITYLSVVVVASLAMTFLCRSMAG